MTQQPQTPRSESRMSGQPAPRPVHPAPAEQERPSFEELTAQAEAADYSSLAEHLDDEARAELGLPVVPAPVTIGHDLFQQIRVYFLDRPAKTAQLPDSVRDLLHL
ncbi:hypothetical protein ACFV9E_03510 [Streptomyces sp. NPDC059835]|uniref:hypothetical protein n=1 Tax=Streptomyces sp. NPDC059835 TaxID=3346967 RepID=UPI003656F76F